MLPLEPTDELAKPAFTDAALCATWIGQLQLTNLNLAQGTLRKQLDELNRYALNEGERFQILEILRDTVAMVQSNFAKKLTGKKLPLADEEFTLLIALSNLWQGMLNGYLRCLQSQRTAEAAVLCQRSLLYGGLQIADFLNAGCEPSANLWQQLHGLYAHVEKLGVQLAPVRDELHLPGLPTNCRTLYVRTLLMHRARLLGLTRTQWHIAERWLGQWGDALSVEPSCSVSTQDAPPLAVDLAGTQGLLPIQQARQASSMRFLALVPLSKLIRVKTILLQQGQTPQQAELGNDIALKDCIDLLGKLHACWCENRKEYLVDAPRASNSLSMCIGLGQIYAHLAGKPFTPLKDTSKSMQDAQRQIETFGRVLDNTGKHALKELGFVPEEWLIEEDSLMRGRLLRLHTTGERLAPNQLISVFPPESTHYKLGIIDFVRATQRGQLYIGVHYLPARPQAIIARGNADNDMLQSGSTPALLLPALERLRIPSSLVLLRDWFSPGRKLEINLPDKSKQNVTLGFSVEKGIDCERVSFKPA